MKDKISWAAFFFIFYLFIAVQFLLVAIFKVEGCLNFAVAIFFAILSANNYGKLQELKVEKIKKNE